MNGAEFLVRCLENEGVEYIFGIPGEENIHVMDELLSSSIQFITVRHEQGAAFMADVYGRLTGPPRRLPVNFGAGRDQSGHRLRRCQYGLRPDRGDRRSGIDHQNA